MANNEGEIAYVRDHWDTQAKGTNYLLAGHGAILVGCLTLLKEGNGALMGFASVGFVSALGLLLAALAYADILIVRSMKIKNLRGHSAKVDDSLLVSGYKFFQVSSFILFVIEMLMIGWRLFFF
jgi:hypothetical protein